jgi:thiol:disulfide interchange protein DsbD
MAAYTLLAGLYLLFLDHAGRTARRFFLAKRAIGAAAALAGVWMLFPRGHSQAGIPFEPYSEQRVEEALAQGKSVLVDFRADWCAACLELEEKTFSNPDVAEAARHLVALKMDMTRVDDPKVQEARRRYGIAGLPHVVLIRPGDRMGTDP